MNSHEKLIQTQVQDICNAADTMNRLFMVSDLYLTGNQIRALLAASRNLLSMIADSTQT